MNKEFFISNRNRISGDIIGEHQLGVFFSGRKVHKSADQDYCFTPNRNFYYLTGIEQDDSILVFHQDVTGFKCTLFIKDSDPLKEKWNGHFLTCQEAKDISGLDSVLKTSEFEGWISRYLNIAEVDDLFLDIDRRNWLEDACPASVFSEVIKKKYPYLNIRNIFFELSRFRAKKLDPEIHCIEKAIEITGKGIERVLRHASPGLMEYQLDAQFRFHLNDQGVRELAFPTICASGVNAVILHYETNHCVLREGDLVLFDCGAQYGYYNADITRTFPVSGRFSDRQKVLYQMVLDVEKHVMESVKPGMKLSDLNEISKKMLYQKCVAIGLVSSEDDFKKYCYHGVSHFLGLDAHDPLPPDTVLEPGMVITVEPGLYIEEEKLGIRIEDDVLVTETGYRNLSGGIPKDIDEIENLMRG